MKRSIILGLCAAAALAACDGDTTAPAPISGQFDLESFGGVAPPIGYEPYEKLNEQNQRVICADTLYSQTIELRTDRTIDVSSNVRSFCGEQSAPLPDPFIDGTYTLHGDSITLRYRTTNEQGLVTSWMWAGERSADALTFSVPVYSETDPGGRLIWVYRRR